MSALLAALAALAFGAGDFQGGLAARNGAGRLVVPLSLLAGLPPLALASWRGSGPATDLPLAWCLLAGGGFALGISLLYRALGRGEMAAVAPITAIVAIAVPAGVDLASGRAPTAALLLGLALAGLSAALLGGLDARWRRAAADRRATASAVLAGLGFAAFYIALDRLAQGRGRIEAVLVVRATAFALTAPAALWRGVPRLRARALALAAGAGLCDATADLLLAFAFAGGGLAATSAIASLYPVVTVLLAIGLLRERPSRAQALGLLLALPAILLLQSG